MDLAKIVKGVIVFFLGIIYTLVSYYVVPILLEFLEDSTYGLDTTLQTIFWIGLITTWILAIIVAPALMIVQGSQS